MSDSPIHVETRKEPGAPILKAKSLDGCVLVIFGITGDLARRKLIPALYHLAKSGALPENFALIGYSRSVASTEELREQMLRAIEKFSSSTPIDREVWARFSACIYSVRGSLDGVDGYQALSARCSELDAKHGTRGNRLYYLAIPPDGFISALRGLSQAGLIYDPARRDAWSRVVIEKPFGRDLASARQLNELVSKSLAESQTYRIDHYLAKETVQNILVFRFGNSIFEPLWNRKYIDHVQITMAEEIGIEGRGRFYEETGVLRDVVQNHLLEVLTLCAMEPPVSFEADEIRDEKFQVLRSLRPFSPADAQGKVVLGQYEGYREEPDVAPDSQMPTYAAMRVLIDNWRWQGVPFYIRAGKGLGKRRTEVAIQFQAVPLQLFGQADACQKLEPNVLVLRIQPDEGIALSFACKVPGTHLSVAEVTMDFSYARSFDKQPLEAYERVLLDCMRGDQTLFTRGDAVDWAWRFMTPILEAWEPTPPRPVALYARGSAGPAEAESLIAPHHWRAL